MKQFLKRANKEDVRFNLAATFTLLLILIAVAAAV